ncbi:sulfate adenylyltransferase [Candidatus Pacearchaeota archaeon]|nr:sulfate adenylyltransferase [Candidatus Pacearchaeota archaeon]
MIGDIKLKIICTIGPGSNKPEILEKLKDRGVNFFRINLSHTNEEDIEPRIKDLLGYGVPIILDTEGSQVRSGNTQEILMEDGNIVKLFFTEVSCDANNLFLRPEGVGKKLEDGDLISIDFNSLLLRVFDTTTKDDGYILCKVVIGGNIGGRKAVQIDSPTFSLPAFSNKDNIAIKLGKRYGIKNFTLSFMESPDHVLRFKQLYPEAIAYSKIESRKGLENFMEIAKVSEGILIDRGDLSSQVPLEKIPFIQKLILKKVREMGKEAIVATNTLEQMALALKPSKAEVNDIINTFLDGATAIALTKETAVGRYPVETVNTLSLLIKQLDFLNKSNKEDLVDKIEDLNYALTEQHPDLIIKPHGGKLVDLFVPHYKNPLPEKSIEINEETLMDAEQIAIGAFSPIDGFLGRDDFNSVVDKMKLSNGVVWPLPITFSVSQDIRTNLKEGESIALKYKGEIHAILHLLEIYTINKEESALKIYGTLDKNHPGVKKFLESEDYFLGGKIILLKRRTSETKVHELTPKQTRKIFAERGWNKIVGFHTRNVIHRSHEFIQKEGTRRGLCDGLFIHPVIGKKKVGDFESHVIIKSYEMMLESFYPKSNVLFGTFATYSRYCGPREALFTALVRKNFGCSHFIVGRDHTGVGNFYPPLAAHEIFSKFTKEEIEIEPVLFGKVFYSELENKHFHEMDFIDHPEEHKLDISGTEARKIFQAGAQPPEWFMRPEISKMILDKLKNGEKVFVEENKNTKILWFTGLSGSGKSTIAGELKKEFDKLGKSYQVFDGDDVRNRLHKHLGFTPEDIKENNRLIAELSKQEFGKVDFILVPIISPFIVSRENARKQFGQNFVEIYTDCSYEECKKRDVKGHYKKAESGELKNFIGLDVPYEPPINPEIKIDTTKESLEEAVQRILNIVLENDKSL